MLWLLFCSVFFLIFVIHRRISAETECRATQFLSPSAAACRLHRTIFDQQQQDNCSKTHARAHAHIKYTKLRSATALKTLICLVLISKSSAIINPQAIAALITLIQSTLWRIYLCEWNAFGRNHGVVSGVWANNNRCCGACEFWRSLNLLKNTKPSADCFWINILMNTQTTTA